MIVDNSPALTPRAVTERLVATPGFHVFAEVFVFDDQVDLAFVEDAFRHGSKGSN